MGTSGSKRIKRAWSPAASRKGRKLKEGEETGTHISFLPDFSVMDPNAFNFNVLMTRFREMAFVTRRVTIKLRDERSQPLPREMTFLF